MNFGRTVSDTFCMYPWVNVHTNTDGRCKLCCNIYTEDYITIDDEMDCQAAASALSVPWQVTGSWDNNAKGRHVPVQVGQVPAESNSFMTKYRPSAVDIFKSAKARDSRLVNAKSG